MHLRLNSLRSKLLVAVFVLVIGSGLVISILVTQRYSESLFETMAAQAENVAHAVALEAADKILINDLVALLKLLNHHSHSHPNISYVFVLKGTRVLAHTFSAGFPTGLMEANQIGPSEQSSVKEIISTDGEHFIDVAWPILDGKVGLLRLGFSEKSYRQRVIRLWIQMSLFTAAILIIALGATLVFVRRITQPLTELVEATKRIDSGNLHARVDVQASDEIGKLAASFNLMVDRVENYIGRLEEQKMEIDRAHRHTRTVCGIVQEIGALNSLQGMTSYLTRTFRDLLGCRNEMVFLLSNTHRDVLFFLGENQRKAIEDKEIIQQCMSKLEGLTKVSFTNMGDSGPPIALEMFQEADRLGIVPISYNGEPIGALVIACSSKCRCPSVGLDNLHAILAQTAGLLKRAILQEEEMCHLQTRLGISSQFCGMVGKDPEMQMVYKLIEDISPTDATVLIQGESGTGKELVARAVHKGSPRKSKPFVVINCSAYPATLLESELFGHEKGAFTGATRQKHGRFEQAQGGTVFLDEIGEISPSAQIKLLRILQTQKFERLGGESTLALDVRILAATNKDLLGEVKAGRFREDLYYRLNVIPIKLPALRERQNDIPLLARHFLQHFATEQKKDMDGFSPEAMRVLLDYSWPGNVRELENSIEHATVLAKGPQVEVYDLPISIRSSESSMPVSEKPPTLVDYEKDILQQVLEECRWNKKEAARRLGISRNTLYHKLKRYSITRPTTH